MTLIELKNIAINTNNELLLKSVNLNIIKNNLIAIQGDSGSGKTTLLKVIAKLLKPSSGDIVYHRDLITDKNLAAFRSHVLLSPNITLSNSESAWQTIAKPWTFKANKHKPFLQKKIKSFIADFYPNLNLEAQTCQTLSNGQMQVIRFAQACFLNPTVLLLDEPANHLDEKRAAIFEQKMQDFMADKMRTIVFTTHSPAQIKRLQAIHYHIVEQTLAKSCSKSEHQ